MKLCSIISAFLAFSIPNVSAASVGLKGAERKLNEESCPSVPSCGSCCECPSASSCGPCCGPALFNTQEAQAEAGAQGRIDVGQTALDALNLAYDGFCNLCELSAIINADQIYCILCDLDLDGDDVDGNDPDVIDVPTACFSEVSTVQVENVGDAVAMKDLKVGDRVLTQSGNYEPVYAFGHKNPAATADFIQFHTADSATSLEMTGAHLVFLQGKTNPVRADSIQVGNVLQGRNSNSGKVLKIKNVQRDGLYTPLTRSGTVVVDGIVASSYISLQKDAVEFVRFQSGTSTFVSFQYLVHMALSPFRVFCMGVSSGLGNAYTEEGVPLYASYGMDLAKWADSQNIVVQFLVFLAFLAITGASMIVENTFGPSMAPVALAVGAGAYYALKKNGTVSLRANKIKSV